jgi:hypothetical protein
MLLVLAALTALLVPATAGASPHAVILDCSDDGKLSRDYSNKELRGALDDMPSDLEEYSDCRQVIGSAIGSGGDGNKVGGNGGAGDTGGSSGSSGGSLSGAQTPEDQLSDQQALAAATADAQDDSIAVGDQQVKPGENGVFDLASAENGVPTPLLLVLIALAVLALGGALLLLRRRLPALGRGSLPTKWTSLPRGLGRPRFKR